MQKITPFLWFNDNAEEAMNFYLSVFKNGKAGHVSRNGDMVMSASFELEGQQFMALNGGPHFKFNEAISLFVDCKDQAEVDELWDKLTEGGEESQCGWLKDKFGLSWQIIPSALGELMGSEDPAKSQAVVQAMLQMGKLDVAKLQEAHDNA